MNDFTKTCEFERLPIGINHAYYHKNNRKFLSKELRDWKEEIAWAFKPGVKLDKKGTYGLEIFIEMGDKRRRDVDSGIKFMLDALSGIVYADDNQVSEVHIYKSRTKKHKTIISVFKL